MYIRRKVFSLLQDETGEERYFSTTDVTLENEEERTFSVAEDAESLEEKDFSDKKKEEDDEPKLTTSDKINIKLNKALTTKKDREAFVEAYEDGKSHKYGKQAAKYAAIGSGIGGGILGAAVGGKKGAAIGAGIGAVSGAFSFPFMVLQTPRLRLMIANRGHDSRHFRTCIQKNYFDIGE